MPTFYHGGIAGLTVGDLLVPSAPHVEDGCPACEARRAGRVCTVGEYRRWLRQFGPRADAALRTLAGAADDAPFDPPSAEPAVYLTTDVRYATWYAACRGHGDVYQVRPLSTPIPSTEDHFPSFTVTSARVLAVVRRRVWLTRTERRDIQRRWRKADRRAERTREAVA